MREVIRHFSARALTKAERDLFDEWIARAGDIAEAYVSSRRGDDPAHYNRIVIATNPEAEPAYLVHAPTRRGIWIVLSLGLRTKVQRFRNLRAALNSIRPVLVHTGLDEVLRVSKMT